MKGVDAVASGVFESEGEQGMEKAGDRTDEHASRKATRHPQVPEVAFPDGGRVLGKQSPQSHGDQSSERGLRFGCVLRARRSGTPIFRCANGWFTETLVLT
jgi:hypothetical protein